MFSCWMGSLNCEDFLTLVLFEVERSFGEKFHIFSQITECLVTPLSDRLDEWRRTANQMDRDCVKELRKAKSELQRAILEAEKCKKRLRRKVRACFLSKMMCC